MSSLKQRLSTRPSAKDVRFDLPVDVLLTALQVVTPETASTPGTVTLGVDEHKLFLDLTLMPFTTQVPYTLVDMDGGFVLTIDLSTLTPLSKALSLGDAAVAGALIAATLHTDGEMEWLEPVSPPVAVALDGVAPCIRITGKPGETATLEFAPSPSQPKAIVQLGIKPKTVMLGSSGFGLDLSQGLIIDASTADAPAVSPPATIDGQSVTLVGDTPSWRGLSLRNVRFFLPEGVPFFGKTAVDAQIEIGLSPPGIALSIVAHAPARDDRPAMTVRIECLDPTATGLASFAPTLIEAEVALDDHGEVIPGAGTLQLNLKPSIARARFSRDPSDPEGLTRIAIALESQGDKGLIQINGKDSVAARGLIGAAAFATALAADGNASQGKTITMLLLAGGALSSLLDDSGKLTVHGIELDSSGHGLPVAGPYVFKVDYSVDVVVRPLDIGVMSVSLDPAQPLRIRMRGVALSINPAGSGLGMFDLDFKHADMEIEDPGRWLVGGPDSLFDAMGSRSGRGSIWLEVDLRFKLNLGPIKVSGATVRATLDTNGGGISVGLRGLDVGLNLPGLIEGKGVLALIAADGSGSGPGFSARLDAKLLPLNLGVDAFITVEPPMVLLGLGVDLPGPIPLANSGLGLFGVGGVVGVAAKLNIDTSSADPVMRQLRWQPWQDKTDPNSKPGFVPQSGAFSFGAQAVVGTLPDLGFSFSAKAGIFLTLPDLAVLGALDAQFLSGPKGIADPVENDPAGIKVRGVVSVSETGTAFALSGTLKIPVLLKADIPVAGSFPSGSDDWYVYIGADGFSAQDRSMGPARVTVLPDIFPQTADGYLMFRGDGIAQWPRGQAGSLTVDNGFIAAFGFHKELFFGKKPFAWVEASGGADILIATNPLIVAGFGQLSGSLHIGPVSLGVSAQVTAYLASGHSYVQAKVCGHVRLLFIKVSRCATLSFGSKASAALPFPHTLPTDQIGADGQQAVIGDNITLVDDEYRNLGKPSRNIDAAPTVWPDSLIRLGFAWAPNLDDGFAPQFEIGGNAFAAQPLGSAFLKYDWRLTSLRLIDVTDAADTQTGGTDAPGPLSAAWQVGRGGDTGVIAQPAELVMLTPQADVWLNRLADNGAALPGDPLSALGNSCHAVANPKGGWTLGVQATPGGLDYWLPPEFVSTDPVQSRVEGRCYFGKGVGSTKGGGGTFLTLDAIIGALPANLHYLPPSIISVVVKAARPFAGALLFPGCQSFWDTEQDAITFDALIALDDYLVRDGVLQMVCLTDMSPQSFDRMKPIVVKDEKQVWPCTVKQAGKNRLIATFQMPAGAKAHMLGVRWDVRLRCALLGIGGITATAQAAADAKQQALDDQAAANAAAAAAPPPADSNSPHSRCVLLPGRTYAVEVAFAWTGRRFEQNESGQAVEIANDTLTDQTDYAPGGGEHVPARARFFFRTAPVPAPAAGGSSVSQYGTTAYLTDKYQKQDSFAPELLERHLAGYEPAQTEVDRFCDDRLRVHFDVSHVALLANHYGYAIKLAVRRTDIGGEAGKSIIPPQGLKIPDTGKFLKNVNLAHYDLAQVSNCPVPVGGAMLEADVQLVARAWYEAYLEVSRLSGPGPKAALPGVTFRTSRWRNVGEMATALGFPATGTGAHSGDLQIAIDAAALPSGGTSDGAFETAMAAIGLAGWPLADRPRVSLLWTKPTDTWLLNGVLVESPEPISRPDRCGVQDLHPALRPTDPAVALSQRISDRTGSRLLYLTPTPFVPSSWKTVVPKKPGPLSPGKLATHYAELVLTMSDDAPGLASATFTGRMRLPDKPLFAGEAF